MWNGIIRFHFFPSRPPTLLFSLNPPITMHKEKITNQLHHGLWQHTTSFFIKDWTYQVLHTAVSSTELTSLAEVSKHGGSGCRKNILFSNSLCASSVCVKLDLFVLECASVSVCMPKQLWLPNGYASHHVCIYVCVWVQAALNTTSLLRFLFYSRRACLLSLSGACPSSAASYLILWEL